MSVYQESDLGFWRKKASISDLKGQLAGNKDMYVNQQLQLASNWFDDVEVLWLGVLKDERMPPRTLAEESKLLDFAEFFLEHFAERQLKNIQEMVAKYGPNVQSTW